MTFLDELALIGCYTDEHVDEYDGDTYTTPSIINHNHRKENEWPGTKSMTDSPRPEN